MFKIKYNQTKFYISSPNTSCLPNHKGIEVAFIGRSNTGKSSLINTITNQKNLAKTSKHPGNTQYINFFQISCNQYFVDLPGYGYSKKTKKNWISNIIRYLKIRQCLKGLVLLIDIRRSIQFYDEIIINNAIKKKIPIILLLSKADKLNVSQRNIVLHEYRKLKSNIEVAFFSSKKLIGLNNLINKINNFYFE